MHQQFNIYKRSEENNSISNSIKKWSENSETLMKEIVEDMSE